MLLFVRLKPKSLWERFKKSKSPIAEPEIYESLPNTDLHILTLEEVKHMQPETNKDSVKTVEALMDEITSFEFITPSPLDGSSIGVIRTEDAYRAICKIMGVEPTSTSFSSYR